MGRVESGSSGRGGGDVGGDASSGDVDGVAALTNFLEQILTVAVAVVRLEDNGDIRIIVIHILFWLLIFRKHKIASNV